VAAGLARRCEIQLAYAIGVAEPVSVYVDTFGTGAVPDAEIARVVGDLFDFRPRAIIETLMLNRPIYRPTAAYGHFGRETTPAEVAGEAVQLFPWESTVMAADLARAVGAAGRRGRGHGQRLTRATYPDVANRGSA
jgi:S-adenosylmethionine synthetase